MLRDVGREGERLRKEKGHAPYTAHPIPHIVSAGLHPKRSSGMGDQEQCVGLLLGPATDGECATHPHPAQRLVYRGRRRELSRYLISLPVMNDKARAHLQALTARIYDEEIEKVVLSADGIRATMTKDSKGNIKIGRRDTQEIVREVIT